MRILVVDDDESILALLDKILSKPGQVDVFVASSGAFALEQIATSEDPFDCLLIDIQMPQIDGVNLTHLVRETPGYGNVPILMLTAMHERSYLDRAFAAGATDYVTKPFDFIDLRGRMQEAQRACVRKTTLQGNPFIAGEMKRLGGADNGIRLENPIALQGSSAVVEDREFENYVMQLARSKAARMTVVAVKLLAVERFYKAMTAEAFRALIEDAATAIGETVLPANGLMTYRGTGVFVCVCKVSAPGDRRRLEDKLNARFAKIRPPTEGSRPTLLVGDPVPLSIQSNLDAIVSLSQAVSSVEEREPVHSVVTDLPARLLGRRRLGSQEDRLDQRAFELLLNETLSSVENDAWQARLNQRKQR